MTTNARQHNFDQFERRMPEVVTRYLGRAPEGTSVVGVDEETALVWSDGRWTVQGQRQVWVLRTSGRTGHAPGAAVDLPPLT